MQKLDIIDIVSKIRQGIQFEATAMDGSFSISIQEYVPYFCTSIHSGNYLIPELEEKSALSVSERVLEEDPYTDSLVLSLPIYLILHDSRYFYDLNRSPDQCIYTEAFGKETWKVAPNESEAELILERYHAFYSVIECLIEKLTKMFKGCLIYDIHSYNYSRRKDQTPLFNLGTHFIDLKRYKKPVEHWKKELQKIELPEIENKVSINSVFKGKGYFSQFVSERFPNALLIPTEIKKVFCKEDSGEVYPQILNKLESGFKNAVLNTAIFFIKRFCNLRVNRKYKLLAQELDKDILRIDNRLNKIVRNFEILSFVNPINLESAKQQFFKSRFKKEPIFKYRPLVFDPFELRRELFGLPIENISDINIRNLYRETILSYSQKADLLLNIGKPNFLYLSLAYYGEPSDVDIANAKFLLHCPDREAEQLSVKLTACEVKEIFERSLKQYDLKCKFELSNKTVADVMTLNRKRKILINKNREFHPFKAQALVHHEIGVHILTTLNAVEQPLKLFRTGLPMATHTQEGIAILSEYYSGYLTLIRLKELALRLIAVELMVKGAKFKEIFERLIDEFGLDMGRAFYLTARVLRGGGFTKDYLYLKGFKDILHYVNKGNSIHNLLIGKTSINHINVINEMIDRKFLISPKHVPEIFYKHEHQNDIIEYLTRGLK